MNIPIDQIKALRATIELGAKGVTSLPLEEIPPALREVIEQGSREINSLVNVLILLENPGIAKELEDLTEQCGVNTSSTFNTPPPRPAFLERDIKNVSEGVLHPSDMELGEDWPVYTLKFKCNQCAAEWSFLSEIPSDNSGCPRGACGGFVASYHSESHSLNALKKEKQEFLKDEEEVVPGVGKTQTPDPKLTPKPPGELDPEIWKCNEPKADTLMPDPAGSANRQLAKQLAEEADKQLAEEAEPRESTPVEKLIDTVKLVFERYPHLRNRLPIAMLTYAEEAQEFLDYQVSRKFFMQVAALHELGYILIQRMDDNDVKEVVAEFSPKLNRIVEGKTD